MEKSKRFGSEQDGPWLPCSHSNLMNTPDECKDIGDIRSEIDRIDRQVIDLLGERFTYVKAAAKFKTSETSVKAPERLEAMLKQRRLWAEEVGLNSHVVERIYRDLVDYFICEEMQDWQKSKTDE